RWSFESSTRDAGGGSDPSGNIWRWMWELRCWTPISLYRASDGTPWGQLEQSRGSRCCAPAYLRGKRRELRAHPVAGRLLPQSRWSSTARGKTHSYVGVERATARAWRGRQSPVGARARWHV